MERQKAHWGASTKTRLKDQFKSDAVSFGFTTKRKVRIEMNLVERSKLFCKRNGSTILTCVGGVGVVATAVLAVKATPKAMKLIKDAEKEKGEKLTKLEVVKTAGPAYIPAAVTGTATIACIFGANVLSKRQQASLASAYALLDNSYKEYKGKVSELYGEDSHDRVIGELAKDKYDEEEVIKVDEEDDRQRLFYDSFSGRYFETTIEKVQQAEYEINRDLSMRDYATVNEFYAYLGLDPIPGGDDLGWSTGMNFDYYWQSWIDFGHQKVLVGDDMECCIITMFAEPTLDWEDYS